MATARVSRGRKSQEIAAEFMQPRGWPRAESRPASLPGSDIMHVEPLDIEVMARKDGLTGLLTKLRQANARGAEVRGVLLRPDGYGPARIAEWPLCFQFETGLWLLRKAGYGEEVL